jgi:hypothetical protein
MDVAMYGATILLGHAIVVSGSNWPVEDYPPDRRSSRIIRPASEAELVASLGTLLAQVDELVVRFSDGDLAREVTFPLVSSKHMDALSVDFTHALTYVGAITGIRAIGGSPISPGH